MGTFSIVFLLLIENESYMLFCYNSVFVIGI